MSIQPFSATISIAFIVSPADRYISAAARGSLMLFAQSAFIRVRVVVSSEPKNSYQNYLIRKINSANVLNYLSEVEHSQVGVHF
jgi:hypothetical protein